MNTTLRLSTIALLAGLLASTSASALSINLGGGGAPLVDLGNANNADTTVSVDTGNLLGGSPSSNSGATIDAAVNLNLGGGNDGTTGGLINDGGTGGVVNLGGNGGLISLGTSDDRPDGRLVDVEIGGLNSGGDLLGLGGNGALIDLGLLGGNGPLIDLAIGGGGGGNGASGGNTVIVLGTGSAASSSRGPATTIAGSACIALSSQQLDQLVNRRAYNHATFNGWASANSLRVVKVRLCAGAEAKVSRAVSASSNVGNLRAFIAGQAKVRAGLQSQGHAPQDVVAADQKGGVLTVYVI